jgi:hypothetical protein
MSRHQESMKVQTRAYFAVSSDVQSPDEMADRIGMKPSSVTRKASRRLNPPVPKENAWQIDTAWIPVPRCGSTWRRYENS